MLLFHNRFEKLFYGLSIYMWTRSLNQPNKEASLPSFQASLFLPSTMGLLVKLGKFWLWLKERVGEVLVMAQREVSALLNTIFNQSVTIERLYTELEEERKASETATTEALSMILRLQEEKATVIMEARHYQRLAEEKLHHAEESLAILEEAMSHREIELSSLMSEREGSALLKTIFNQSVTIERLYTELEEERNASETATTEALSMISRLQEEKATVMMEARQYQRLAEEKLHHAEESLAILGEAMSECIPLEISQTEVNGNTTHSASVQDIQLPDSQSFTSESCNQELQEPLLKTKEIIEMPDSLSQAVTSNTEEASVSCSLFAADPEVAIAPSQTEAEQPKTWIKQLENDIKVVKQEYSNVGKGQLELLRGIHWFCSSLVLLREETDTKKLELLKANQKKNKLLAEVKFLRRKLKSFSEVPSLKTPHRAGNQFEEVKQPGSGKQSGKAVMPSARHVRVRGKNHVHASTSHLEERNYSSSEAPVPGNNALLDLNKDAEELEGWQSPRLNMRSMDNGVMTNDLKLPLCRDVGNEASQVGRRKISWQDQLPLRV